MSTNFPMVPSGIPLPLPPKNLAEAISWAGRFTMAVQHLNRVLSSRLEDMLFQGTLAVRPAAEGTRRFYWATDTDTLYYDEGTWVAVGGGVAGPASIASGAHMLFVEDHGEPAITIPGPQGPQGFGGSGPAGAQGRAGVDGIDGDDGAQGSPGQAGVAGSAGAAGLQGPIGFPGFDGTDGEDAWLPGPAGAPGAAGAAGATGPQGPTAMPVWAPEEPELPLMIPGPKGDTGAAGGGGGSATTIERDLGSAAVTNGKFTITDGDIGTSSSVLCWQAPGAYTGKGTRADEAEMQPVKVTAVAQVAGSATVFWEAEGHVAVVPQSFDGFHGGARQVAVPSVQTANDNMNSRYFARRIGRARGNVKFSYVIFA